MNGIAWISGWLLYERTIILVLSFYVVFDAFSRSFFYVIRAYERMEIEAVINISERIFLVIITLCVGFLNLSLLILVVIFMIFELIKAIISLIIVKKKLLPFTIKFYTDGAFPLLKNALPFALMAIFTTVSMRIDTVMIKIFHSAELSGIYSIAHKIIESITFIPENIYHAFFPVVASLYLIDRSKFNQTLRNAFRITSLLAIPIACIFFFRASDIVALLFKPEYHSAYIALQWLALAMFALFIKYAVAVAMNVSGRQHLFSLYVGISMALNVILNLLLIPQYGLMGAGLATLASELLTTIMGLLSLHSIITFKNTVFYFLKFTLVTALLGWLLYLLQPVHLFIALPIFLIVYILSLFVSKLIKLRDVDYFKQFLTARADNVL
jgi:O-antigen/teichoic acid export membrane protein